MSDKILKLSQAQTLYQDLRERSAPVIINSAIGNPIVFTDGADGLSLSKCKLILLPRQSGSGDASPENIRSMISWENVGTWTGGANVFDPTGYTHNNYNIGNFKNNLKPNTTYIFSINGTTNGRYKLFYSSDPLATSPQYATELTTYYLKKGETQSFTTPSEMGKYLILAGNESGLGNVDVSDILPMINIGSSVSPFVPYNPITSHPIDLTGIASPVYGCEIDLVTGEVWGTWDTVDLGSLSWSLRHNEDNYWFYSDNISNMKIINTTSELGEIVSDRYKNVFAANIYNGSAGNNVIGQDGQVPKIRIRDDSFNNDADAFKTAMSGILLVYKLATPVLLDTLTSQQIKTLLGTNTIWSDADSIEIEYRADTGLFINQNGVKDVQINGSSIINNGVANIPLADDTHIGAVKINSNYGWGTTSDGYLCANGASSYQMKQGTDIYRPIVSANQHVSVFFALAKIANADLASETVTIGTYPQQAKTAIQTMLGIENGVVIIEEVGGTTPAITGIPNYRYVCGEVSTISITPPTSGTIDVRFNSGSTATVMTVPSTVKWPEWFDADNLEANVIYEVLITDGIYGSVMTWA